MISKRNEDQELLYELTCKDIHNFLALIFHWRTHAWLRSKWNFHLTHIYWVPHYMPGTLLGTGDAKRDWQHRDSGSLESTGEGLRSIRNRRKHKVGNCRKLWKHIIRRGRAYSSPGVKAPWEKGSSWEVKDEKKLATSMWPVWIVQHAGRNKAK